MAAKRKVRRNKSRPTAPRRPRSRAKELQAADVVELRALTEIIALKQAEFNHKFAECMARNKLPIATTAVCFECYVARPRNVPCNCPAQGQQQPIPDAAEAQG